MDGYEIQQEDECKVTREAVWLENNGEMVVAARKVSDSMRSIERTKTMNLLEMLLFGVICPKRVIQDADDMGWGKIMMAHLLGWCVVVIGYVVWHEFDWHAIRWSLGTQWSDVQLVVCGLELVWLLICIGLSPWAARPWEGVGESVRRGLKRGLSVTVFGGLILLCAMIGVEALSDHSLMREFYLSHGMVVKLIVSLIYTVIVLGLWTWPGLVLIWAMGVGGRGWNWESGEGMRELWPLRCEGKDGCFCGYQMVNVKVGVMCPECGAAVIESVAKKSKRYVGVGEVSFVKRLKVGVLGWGARGAVMKPRGYGEKMEVGVPMMWRTGKLVWPLVLGVLVMIVVGAVSSGVYFMLEVMRSNWAFGWEDMLEVWIAMPMVGGMAGSILSWLFYGLVQAVVLVLGLVLGMAGGGNRLYALQRLMCDQFAYAVVGVVCCNIVMVVAGMIANGVFGGGAIIGAGIMSACVLLYVVLGVGMLTCLVLGVLGVKGDIESNQ